MQFDTSHLLAYFGIFLLILTPFGSYLLIATGDLITRLGALHHWLLKGLLALLEMVGEWLVALIFVDTYCARWWQQQQAIKADRKAQIAQRRKEVIAKAAYDEAQRAEAAAHPTEQPTMKLSSVAASALTTVMPAVALPAQAGETAPADTWLNDSNANHEQLVEQPVKAEVKA